MRELGHRNLAFDQDAGLAALDKLIEPAEADLLTLLATWPEVYIATTTVISFWWTMMPCDKHVSVFCLRCVKSS